MLTKRQTDAAAEALLHNRREQLERKDSRLIWYPELNKIPFPDRPVALNGAKHVAWRSWPVVTLVCVCIAASVGWYFFREAGAAGFEQLGLIWAPLSGLTAMAHRSQTRRELRRKIGRQHARLE